MSAIPARFSHGAVMPGTTGTRTQNIDPVIDGIEVVEEFKGRPADPLPRLLDFCTRPTGAWPYVPASRVTYPTPQDFYPGKWDGGQGGPTHRGHGFRQIRQNSLPSDNERASSFPFARKVFPS
ncbi:MAG TPA: hypothetical protein GX513_06825 [Firmicutes bacterium]|nr:hypothetical protein [Bacillota bacterium]